MPCYDVDLPGGGHAIVRGSHGKHCAECRRAGEFLCDFPVGRLKLKTCDRRMCKRHRGQVAPGVDYCAKHLPEWHGLDTADRMPFRQPELF